jgi:transcriptional regulator with XRE-family HTH domain
MWLTVSELAAVVGVSPQTLRVWEAKGLVVPQRSKGGQRLYGDADQDRVRQIVKARKRHGWNPAAILSQLPPQTAAPTYGDPELGARIRLARKARSLTQAEVAQRSGLSRPFLAAIERGESAPSVDQVAQIAKCIGVALRDLAPKGPRDTLTLGPDGRPTTKMAGGVVFEELAPAARYLDPALIVAPPRSQSGGPQIHAGETFVYMLEGSLVFHHSAADERLQVPSHGSILLPRASRWWWQNETDETARAIYVQEVLRH